MCTKVTVDTGYPGTFTTGRLLGIPTSFSRRESGLFRNLRENLATMVGGFHSTQVGIIGKKSNFQISYEGLGILAEVVKEVVGIPTILASTSWVPRVPKYPGYS
eukprot:209085-Rhodomonas_salina.1